MKPLTKEFLLARGKCCKNSCKNCPYKEEENFELEEIPLNIRWEIYDLLYPEIFILVRTSPDCEEWLTRAHIPTHKIKINK